MQNDMTQIVLLPEEIDLPWEMQKEQLELLAALIEKKTLSP